MTTGQKLELLTFYLTQAGVPFVGVRAVEPFVDYAPEATAQQRAQGDQIAASGDFSDAALAQLGRRDAKEQLDGRVFRALVRGLARLHNRTPAEVRNLLRAEIDAD